jgi:cardiolipin synthase A/B
MVLGRSVKNFSRKFSFSLLIGSILIFYTWLVFAASRTNLPDQEHPLRFYSNQTRHDIKSVYYHALERARHSIFLSVYGVTDPDILSILIQKAENKVPVTVEYDSSASSNLKKILPSSAHVLPIKSKGLMHRKVVLIDQAQVFLGSANLTATSLRHHDNLVLGIYSPSLAEFLENPTSTSFSFVLHEQKAEVFLLPDPEHSGLKHLLNCLGEAKVKISIAMFTLTHPEIAEALIKAKNRGVAVSIAADYYTAKGASKKILNAMEKEGIKILNSQGRQLLHHKWALIDENILVMGSANWTKAAFSKNHDFLFFLSPLDQAQKQFLNGLWQIIELESLERQLQNSSAWQKRPFESFCHPSPEPYSIRVCARRQGFSRFCGWQTDSKSSFFPCAGVLQLPLEP